MLRIFLFWSLWLSLEFLLGPYSHVRIHDAGDGFLPQAIAARIQFTSYGLSYFAAYAASGIDATAQLLVPFTNFNNFLLTALPGWLAMGLLMFLQRFIASYFTYKLLSEILKISLWPSVAAAMIFSLFNFSIFSFTFYHHLGLPALPLVLFIMEKIFKMKNPKMFFMLIFSGAVFGYISYFIYSSIYLLPFIFFWFIIIRGQPIFKSAVALTVFSLSTLVVQMPSIYALFINSEFSHRSIWDPSIFLRGDLIKSIVFDLKSKILTYVVPLSIILISLKFLTKIEGITKILLLTSSIILILPIVFKFVQVALPIETTIIRTFSIERFDLLLPFVLAITAALLLNNSLRKTSPVAKIIIFSLIIVVLILSSLKIKIETLKNYAPYRNLYTHPQLVGLSQQVDSTRFRVATITGGGIRSSYALAYGLSTVDSYLTLYPQNYHDFWKDVIAQRIKDDKLRYDDFVKWGNRIYLYGPQDFYSLDEIEFQKYYNLDLLSLAGVRYVISQKPVADNNLSLLPSNYREEFSNWYQFSKFKKLSKFLSGDYFGPPLYIYENKKAQPRFFTLENGQTLYQNVDVEYYSPDKIILTVNATKPASLVATINHYPWWQALVNDQIVPISKFQGTFMSVEIPKGDSNIILEYDPPYKIF